MKKLIFAVALLVLSTAATAQEKSLDSWSSGLSMAPRPSAITFNSNNGVVVTLKADGTIEVGPGYTPTEAGDAFIRIVRKMWNGCL